MPWLRFAKTLLHFGGVVDLFFFGGCLAPFLIWAGLVIHFCPALEKD